MATVANRASKVSEKKRAQLGLPQLQPLNEISHDLILKEEGLGKLQATHLDMPGRRDVVRSAIAILQEQIRASDLLASLNQRSTKPFLVWTHPPLINW